MNKKGEPIPNINRIENTIIAIVWAIEKRRGTGVKLFGLE
ncbi:hypothetical protein LPTSP1_30550 [Leptospira johnsonii]|uniref:Uncharacterized protein n=1 Tax=Leptospira johnsonii TaxID=1917820 RepID=A0A2P2D5Y3_9LEPT|nr:hypothetical protein LPTSP1_30550 [Leptospira johnsonii]